MIHIWTPSNRTPLPTKSLTSHGIQVGLYWVDLGHFLCKMVCVLLYMKMTQTNKKIPQILQRTMETSQQMLVDRVKS